MTNIGIIDNTKYCKKHNCLHAKGSACPHCWRADKKDKVKIKKSPKVKRKVEPMKKFKPKEIVETKPKILTPKEIQKKHLLELLDELDIQ